MTQDVLHHPQRHPAGDAESRGGAAQVVEPDRRQIHVGDEPSEPAGQPVRAYRPLAVEGEHRPPGRDRPLAMATTLPFPVRGEHGQKDVVEGEAALPAGALRRPADPPGTEMDDLFLNVDQAPGLVEVAPAQAGDLTSAQPAQRDQPPQCGEIIIAGGIEEPLEVRQIPPGHLVLVHDASNSDIEPLCARLTGAFHQPFTVDSTKIMLGVSIGAVVSEAASTHPRTVADFIRRADAAMYASKLGRPGPG